MRIKRMGDYTVVILDNKDYFFIDSEDERFLYDASWYIGRNGYVTGRINGKLIYFHRYILGVTNKKNQIDHKNRNKIDNRKNNLRICTNIDNARNRNIQSNNTSGFIGVSFDITRNKWAAYFKEIGIKKFLGRFENMDDAIKARLLAEKQNYGDFAPQSHLFKKYKIKG